MAKISKIRVSCFTYDDNNKIYPDTVFDIEGMQALLQQANGTGKTTLIQMLEAVLVKPGKSGTKTAMSRMVAQTNFRPAHFLIEWEIDGLPGASGVSADSNRVLTGYTIRKSPHAERGTAWEIKYYFAAYGAGCGFMPEDIPLAPTATTESGERTTFLGYSAVDDYRREHPHPEITIYQSHNMNAYQQRCREYGLPVDEWSDILVNLNKGGANTAEYLRNAARNSRELFELTMEDTIVSRVTGGQATDPLEDATTEYMMRAHKKKANTNALNTWKELSLCYSEVSEPVKACRDAFRSLRAASAEVRGMRAWLAGAREDNEQDAEACRRRRVEIAGQRELNRHMRLSKSVHDAEDRLAKKRVQHAELLEAAEEMETEAAGLHQRLGDIRHTLYEGERAKLDSTICSLQAEYDNLTADGELSDRRAAVASRLVPTLADELARSREELSAAQGAFSSAKDAVRRAEAESGDAERARKAASEGAVRAGTRLDDMEAEEKKAIDALNKLLKPRNLSLALSIDRSKLQNKAEVETRLKTAIGVELQKAGACRKEKSELERQAAGQEEVADGKVEERRKLGMEAGAAKSALKSATELRERVDRACEKHGTDLKSAFAHNAQDAYLESRAQTAAAEKSAAAGALADAERAGADKKAEISEAEERLAEVKRGHSFTDPAATAALEAARIPHITVIKRLQEIRANSAAELHHLVPLIEAGSIMPYGIIVDDERMQRAAVEAINEAGGSKITPVYTQRHVDSLIASCRERSALPASGTEFCASNPWVECEVTPQVMVERDVLESHYLQRIADLEREADAIEVERDRRRATLDKASGRLQAVEELKALAADVRKATGGSMSAYAHEQSRRAKVKELADKDAELEGAIAEANGKAAELRERARAKEEEADRCAGMAKEIEGLAGKVSEVASMHKRKLMLAKKLEDREAELAEAVLEHAAKEEALKEAREAKEAARRAAEDAERENSALLGMSAQYGQLPCTAQPCEPAPLDTLVASYLSLTKMLEAESERNRPKIEEVGRKLEEAKAEAAKLEQGFADFKLDYGFTGDCEFKTVGGASKLLAREAETEYKEKEKEASGKAAQAGAMATECDSAEDDVRDALAALAEAGFEAPLPKEEVRSDLGRHSAEIARAERELDERERSVKETAGKLDGIGSDLDAAQACSAGACKVPADPKRAVVGSIEDAAGRARELAALGAEKAEDLARGKREVKGKCKRIAMRGARMASKELAAIYETADIVSELLDRYEAELTEGSFEAFCDQHSKMLEGIEANIDALESDLEELANDKVLTCNALANRAKYIREQLENICKCSGYAKDGNGRYRMAMRITKIAVDDSFDEAAAYSRVEAMLDDLVKRALAVEDGAAGAGGGESTKSAMTELYRRHVTSFGLLQQFLGEDDIKIELMKVERHSTAARWCSWEKCAQHSGAEIFCDCLSVIAATSLYSRLRYTGSINSISSAISSCNYTTTLILDNPFGETSSDEFVSYMYEVARRAKIQLIALSDLSPSAAIKNVGVHYLVSFDKTLYGDKTWGASVERISKAAPKEAATEYYKVTEDKDAYVDENQETFDF